MSFDYAVWVTKNEDGWTFDWRGDAPILRTDDALQVSFTQEEGWYMQVVKADYSVVLVHVIEAKR